MARIRIRLTPRGGRDRIEGWTDGPTGPDGQPERLLCVRVKAPPVDGRANDALVALLARTVGAARSEVRIVAGASSRLKTVEIDGGDPESLG